jgi:hypothetical protein
VTSALLSGTAPAGNTRAPSVRGSGLAARRGRGIDAGGSGGCGGIRHAYRVITANAIPRW